MKDIKVPNSDAAQAELFATNFKLPPTNTSVIGYYETSSQEYSHAVVYREEEDGLWYESRLMTRSVDTEIEVDKPDIWCFPPSVPSVESKDIKPS